MKRLRSWSFLSFNPWSFGRVIWSVPVPQRRCISFRNCGKRTCHVKWITNQLDSLILKVIDGLAYVQIVEGEKQVRNRKHRQEIKSKLLRLGWRQKMLHLNLRQLLLNLKSSKADEIIFLFQIRASMRCIVISEHFDRWQLVNLCPLLSEKKLVEWKLAPLVLM